MTGFVDDQLRALLPVSASRDQDRTEIPTWIDTAFNGGLRSEVVGLLERGRSRQQTLLVLS